MVVVAMALYLPCSVLSFSIVLCDFFKSKRERESDKVLLTYLKHKKKVFFLFHFLKVFTSMSLHKDTTFTSKNLIII